MDAEIIIVGAGPAGAAAAYHLAHRGRDVLLLDRKKFPRDKSCGDRITLQSLRLLDEMGVLPHLKPFQKICGVRVFMRGKGARDFEYPQGLSQSNYGAVIPRFELDYKICQQAVAEGATLWENAFTTKLIWDNDTVIGIEVRHDGELKRLKAPVVIAADGASSRLSRQAGLQEAPLEQLGFAVRGYYSNIDGLTDLLEIHMPLMDITDRYLLPSYGWVSPTGPSSANIGVGIFQRTHGVNIRELFNRFLSELKVKDPRFQYMRSQSSWLGAPLRSDFSPDRCFGPGILLVGDAAGLISPFTGGGISYALESGKLAAEAIDLNLRKSVNSTPNLSDYAILLEREYTGYFETGRHTTRRYLLVWHVLESTFQNERPLFELCRKAVLFPEGVGEFQPSHILDDVGPLIEHRVLDIREDLLATAEVLTNILRQDWPFLTRLSFARRGDPGIPFRPALLLLLSGYLGNPKKTHLIQSAAAIELGYLAALAHISIEEEPNRDSTSNRSSGNWGNKLAVMVGDFLLSKAFELSAEIGEMSSNIIAKALEKSSEGRMLEIRNKNNLKMNEKEYTKILTYKIATLFELPCWLGAHLAGLPSKYINALRKYGCNLGLAFQIMDELLLLTGKESPLAKASGLGLGNGIYNLPILKAMNNSKNTSDKLFKIFSKPKLTKNDLNIALKIVNERGMAEETKKLSHNFASEAEKALNLIHNHPAIRSLFRLASYAVTRKVPKPIDYNV